MTKSRTEELIRGAIRDDNGQGSNLLRHGAFAIVNQYYRGNIDKRTTLGLMITAWEEEYASHRGHASYAECPITLREKIRLAIGLRLFQMFFVPQPESKTGLRELRSSENALNRILTELGLERRAKPVENLEEYLASNYGEQTGNSHEYGCSKQKIRPTTSRE